MLIINASALPVHHRYWNTTHNAVRAWVFEEYIIFPKLPKFKVKMRESVRK